MRADIHDGPEHMLQSEAGYIDARPLTPARQNLLQRTAGPYMRVICVVSCVRGQFPVYPSQPTYRRAQVPSVRGIMRPRRTGGSWRILLQKSFWDDERKFSKALARVARGDVRDHIVSRKNHHGPAYRRHGAFQ